MPSSIVLDSFAVIAYLEEAPGHETVGELLRRATDGDAELGISVVNLGEIWYHFARKQSAILADQVVNEIHELRIEAIDVSWAMTRQAAAFKAFGGISYADCFAAALAKMWNAPLVTGDPEFKRLEKEIDVRWLKRR